ncbi:phosphatidylinositol mannoside acyltransferase [Phaeacidiphilus oryzae]|uniref:phosphatidylinositol mannoside acyltransferase n=1 Tax=Phaeacidiphilus oryzae TaxID=348818 RepID=UPI00190FB7CF
MPSRLADEANYLAYAAGWGLVKRLPEPVARRLFAGLGDYAARRRGPRVQRLEANLRRVRPKATDAELTELVRLGMRSYMRYWLESFRLPVWSKDRIRTSFAPQHVERLDQNIEAGRGVVFALPHMANWDLAGAWVVARGLEFTTVAERLKPEKLFDRFVAYREGLGMEVLPLTGGAATMALLARRLRKGGLVCLVGDRDLSESGIEVSFMDEATRMPAGPAALAVGTGAALLPVSLWFDGENPVMQGMVHEEIEVPRTGTRKEKIAAMTQSLADVWAEAIKEHPQDWHMLSRYWLADLDPRREPRG